MKITAVVLCCVVAAGSFVETAAFAPNAGITSKSTTVHPVPNIRDTAIVVDRQPVAPTVLHAVTSQSEAAPDADYDALVKYHVSISVQMALIAGVLKGFDVVMDVTGMDAPFWVTVPLFYGFSLKSRIFNPLQNNRPNLKAGDKGGRGFNDRTMPSWTPPGVTFPIMWLLIIGPLRAYSSALIVDTTGSFLNPAILALMFHLSVGDVWNTINNIERRYGAAVTGVLCVTATALNAAYQYHQVDEQAGNLLGLPMIWFAVAASLVTATWQLNPVSGGDERDALYPVAGASSTEFAWFQSQSDNDE